MRIALGVEYDGRPYCGWQSQAEGLTVQDTLQHALGQIAGDQFMSEKLSVIAAGAPIPACMRWSRWCISIPGPTARLLPGCAA